MRTPCESPSSEPPAGSAVWSRSSSLAAGHDVQALVRSPDKLSLHDPHLSVHVGQLFDVDAVAGAVRGSDAVISALGPSLRRGARGTPITDGTLVIVAAMEAAGVRRFIGLATPSVPDPRDRPTLKGRLLPLMARAAFPNALVELRGMMLAVAGSNLDWTLARITRPIDRPARARCAPASSAATGSVGR